MKNTTSVLLIVLALFVLTLPVLGTIAMGGIPDVDVYNFGKGKGYTQTGFVAKQPNPNGGMIDPYVFAAGYYNDGAGTTSYGMYYHNPLFLVDIHTNQPIRIEPLY